MIGSIQNYVTGRFALGVVLLAPALLLFGCTGNGDDASSQTQQQQESSAPMPESAQPQTLSSSDVSDEQIQKAARIAISVQMRMQQDRRKLQKDLQSKYGNPQQMDSTQKQAVRKEIRRRQIKMRKQQMQMMQKRAKEEGMNPQTFRQIMRSAQQDSTLQKRLQSAMRAQMKQRRPQMGGGTGGQ